MIVDSCRAHGILATNGPNCVRTLQNYLMLIPGAVSSTPPMNNFDVKNQTSDTNPPDIDTEWVDKRNKSYERKNQNSKVIILG